MQKNYLPEIQQSQSIHHLDTKVKSKMHSPSSSIEWDQLINTSIPNSVKQQLNPKGQTVINLSKLGPCSDISYLRSTKRNFAKLGTSIYKEPELQQTKYDKNLQSFYGTLYRKTNTRIPFNTNLEKERFQGHLLDFTELFQDNQRSTNLQKYFGEILKLEMQQSIQEKEMIPPNRQQAIDLRDWLFMMIAYTKQESSNMSTRELAERIQLIYASCLRELIKQVSIECTERGDLLQTVWDFYVELIGQIIKCYSEQQRESEKSYLEQMQRIQSFHDSQMEIAKVRYQEYQNQILTIKNETSDSIDELNMTKAKMLLLTSEMRLLIETNETQKNEIDSLLLQLMLLKTQDNNENKKFEDQQIDVQLAKGKSIVSHLLNYKTIATEYKFNKKKVKNTNFEKFESLREQEQQLKFDLIQQQILEPDIEYVDEEVQVQQDLDQKETQTDLNSQELNQQILQLEKLQSQILQMEEQQQNKDQLIVHQQYEIDQQNYKSVQEQLILEQRLKEAISLIQESELDCKESICETINLSIKKSQHLSSRLILLEKEETQKKIDLMEKEDENQELESKLTQAVQDFIQIIKQKKNQIKRLMKQKSSLQGTLKQITTTYNIEINQLDTLEEEKDSSQFKSYDQSSDIYHESKNVQQDDKYIDEQDELDYQLTDRSRIKDQDEGSKAKKQLKRIIKGNDKNDSLYIASEDEKKLNDEDLERYSSDHVINQEQTKNSTSFNQFAENQTPIIKANNNDLSISLHKARQPSLQNIQKQKKQPNTPRQTKFSLQNEQFKEENNNQIPSEQQFASRNSQQLTIKKIDKIPKQPSSSQLIDGSQQQNQQSPQQRKQQLVIDNELFLNVKNQKSSKTQKHSILEQKYLSQIKSSQEFDEINNSNNQFSNSRASYQFEIKSKGQRQNQFDKNINLSQNDESQSDEFEFESSPGIINNIQGERVKSVIMQYKDQKNKIRSRYNPIQLEQKNAKRFRRVYSQNTDIANGLLTDVKMKKKPNKKIQFSILQLQKLVTQILNDICKQAEGYKIPFHVCIYDYYKNKYGFKQVAEKKIRQVYQFILYEKGNHIKAQLLAQFCYMLGEMDEIGQKLLTESYQYFSSKNDLNYGKVDLLLTYEQASEFLTEKSSRWLYQQQIQSLLQLYRNQQQNNQRYFINHDSLLIKILELYSNNKKDQQSILESLFKAADLDGNKLIEFSEFKTLYRAIHQEKLSKSQLLSIFTNNADFQDENGDKMLTLPRFTEMSIELGIFQKEIVLKYGEGSESLMNYWERDKTGIKYRFLRAKKFQKVRHTFLELENQIKFQEKDKQLILWVSYKLLNEESQRVLLNYETRQCMFQLLPELYIIEQLNKDIEQLE
ncbi:unnamed protein product (macronuclear) [Paramecium tetraurelia]|uniref:EF-hand domain-containing protein n=1 Tax=Paramecium tetraurelia TaxID=5888 RepID=A0DZ22_PARTE|nr:uncharacterized protein GSPATT00003258001 [Paramecium tetraurelia]CAK88289.1 unnamed protein product [Paramecium tetraurelia]|eukprot:XP_001455686.1 hypothetical protein (macronuclear) [Paramecium tetraurelia strain d4-2]